MCLRRAPEKYIAGAALDRDALGLPTTVCIPLLPHASHMPSRLVLLNLTVRLMHECMGRSYEAPNGADISMFLNYCQ
jgi:hypothetical protein